MFDHLAIKEQILEVMVEMYMYGQISTSCRLDSKTTHMPKFGTFLNEPTNIDYGSDKFMKNIAIYVLA